MPHIGTVLELRRYPVKSLLGERLDAATVTNRGLEGDRTHAFVETEGAKVATAKRPQLWRDLLRMQATIEPLANDGSIRIRITLADGRTFLSTDDDLDAAVSAAVGRPVKLSAARRDGHEIDRSHPDVVLRDGIGSAASFDTMPLGAGAPVGGFFDYAPAHVLTTASLARVAAAAPDADLPALRYRPNIVIDNAGGEPFAENDWVGRELRIGGTCVLRAVAPTPRCAVPTLQHGDDHPAERHALTAVAGLNRAQFLDLGLLPCLGAYAQIVHAGEIRCGDAVELVDA